MGYYAKNPYEAPEDPRCVSCDEFMVEVKVTADGGESALF